MGNVFLSCFITDAPVLLTTAVAVPLPSAAQLRTKDSITKPMILEKIRALWRLTVLKAETDIIEGFSQKSTKYFLSTRIYPNFKI